MRIEYFGTSMTAPGHYFWIVNPESLTHSNRRFEALPFNAEQLPWRDGKYLEQRGQYTIHNFAGFTIVAFSGSPIDKRGGCKSVFFVEGNLSNEEIMKLLNETPMAMRIIKGIHTS